MKFVSKRMSIYTYLIMKTSWLFFILMLSIGGFGGCKEEVKEEDSAEGEYAGKATDNANSANTKSLSLNITNSSNPVAGTYTFDKGSNAVQGNVSGTGLGLIYTLTLKPKTAGVTYTMQATWDGGNSISGTMTGFEATKNVTYKVELKK